MAQNKSSADSLKNVYIADTISVQGKLDLLTNLAFHTTDNLEESIKYAEELISLANRLNNIEYLLHGYSQKGQTYRMAGDMTEALDAFFKASEYAQKLEDERYLGGGYLTIADTYSEIENNENAENYYKKSIAILRRTEDTLTLASAILNSGYHHYLNDKYDKALLNYEESAKIFTDQNGPAQFSKLYYLR